MSVLETVQTLIDRLKSVDNSTNAAEFEELAAGVDFLNEADTYENAVAFADFKKNEISQLAGEAKNTSANFTASCLAELQAAKENSLAAIPNVDGILSPMVAEKSKIINDIVDNFAAPDGFPDNSTICTEISDDNKWKSFLETGSIPIIFGILSRYNDYNYGSGVLADAIAAPGSGSFNPNQILQMLIGAHNYTTEYAGFYKYPRLCFLQGTVGNFVYRELYTTPALTTYQYNYGRMAVGCMFVKNTTDENITRNINAGGSFFCNVATDVFFRSDTRRNEFYGNVYDSSTGGLAVSVGYPLNDNLSWSGLTQGINYSVEVYYQDQRGAVTQLYPSLPSLNPWSGSLAVTVPAHVTVVIILCTTAWFWGSAEGCYFQFLHWYLFNVRSLFLGNGLEIDLEMTRKAIQCSGLNNTINLWGSQ
jgi:hypothetical protein